MIPPGELDPVDVECSRCGHPQSIVRFVYKPDDVHNNNVASLCLTCYNILISHADSWEEQMQMAEKYAKEG